MIVTEPHTPRESIKRTSVSHAHYRSKVTPG
ncbi:hypothetical protein ABH925_006156 [Streptacidiphilus sp. EB129]